MSFDPGGDAQSGANRNFPRDAFGMMLGYFPGDFERGSSQFNSGGSHTVGAFNLPGRPLFNGNITSWTSETQAAPSGTPGTRKYEQKTGENYRYDVLNRLLESVFSTYAGGHWDTTANHEYSTSYQYDANGNILRLKRNGYNAATLGAPMDNLLYGYQPGTNRLDSVDDTVARNAYPGDQDDQHKHNYRYDASGNMVQDIEDSVVVKWNWQGKIEQIKKRRHPKNDSTASLWGISQTIKYLYDPAGQRIRKEVIEDMDSVHGRVTYYVRDANEQVMAIYEGDWVSTTTPTGCLGVLIFPKDADCDNVPDGLDNCPKMSNPLVMGIQMDSDTDGVGNACDPCTGWDPWQEDWDGDGAPDACDNCPANPDPSCTDPHVHHPRTQPQLFAPYYVKLSEWHLYGSGSSGLLATVQPDTAVWRDTTTQHDTLYTRRVGYKLYQLKDHLGNVRAIVSDMKYCSPATPGVRPFTADLRSYMNYYPFGQEQPARVWNSDTVRYGYNGKEKDDEVAGDGNQYDYGFRIYNPRLGRFLSVDPLAPQYPWYTPYQFAGNKPIRFIDRDGLEEDDPEGGEEVPKPSPRDADGNPISDPKDPEIIRATNEALKNLEDDPTLQEHLNSVLEQMQENEAKGLPPGMPPVDENGYVILSIPKNPDPDPWSLFPLHPEYKYDPDFDPSDASARELIERDRPVPLIITTSLGVNGQILSAEADIGPENINGGMATNQPARDLIRSMGGRYEQEGYRNDQAGHIFGRLLGGQLMRNLFPQAPGINMGTYRVWEREVADIILQGNTIHARVDLIYTCDPMRPSQLLYSITVNGATESMPFDNP